MDEAIVFLRCHQRAKMKARQHHLCFEDYRPELSSTDERDQKHILFNWIALSLVCRSHGDVAAVTAYQRKGGVFVYWTKNTITEEDMLHVNEFSRLQILLLSTSLRLHILNSCTRTHSQNLADDSSNWHMHYSIATRTTRAVILLRSLSKRLKIIFVHLLDKEVTSPTSRIIAQTTRRWNWPAKRTFMKHCSTLSTRSKHIFLHLNLRTHFWIYVDNIGLWEEVGPSVE